MNVKRTGVFADLTRKSKVFGSAVRILLLSMLLVFVLPVIVKSSASAASAASNNGWILVQEDKMTGGRTVYLSPRGLRVDSANNNAVIVSTPPAWKVIVYSLRLHRFYECPSDKFVNMMSKPMAVAYGVNLATIPLKKKGAVTKCGVQASEYETPFRLKLKEFWDFDPKETSCRRLPATAHAVFSQSLKIPEAEVNTLIRLYNIPKVEGVPLVFEFNDQDNDHKWYLRTFSIQAADIPDAKFSKPGGLARVSTMQEVVSGADNADLLKNLF